MRHIPPDLAPYSSDKPEKAIHLLFIHHSCGGQFLADRGDILEKYPGTCIFASHPNGGSLRSALERNRYIVHEASYGSSLGQETDICSWRVKFSSSMRVILSCEEQDRPFRRALENRIVMFKSCYPNSLIPSEGREPGDPDSRDRTTANYKAAYLSLLPLFARHPQILFVSLTAPPLVRPAPTARDLATGLFRSLQGRPRHVDVLGRRTRAFNNWLTDMDNGWLKGYGHMNVVVFDYYDILTGNGASNWSLFPTGGGTDSHPSFEGNTRAAQAFIPFLNKAVRRAGL